MSLRLASRYRVRVRPGYRVGDRQLAPRLAEIVGEPRTFRSLPAPRRDALVEQLAADGIEATPDVLVTVPVRAISADLVPGHWVDHSDPDHLRAAVPLFSRVPVYPNHCAWPSNWLGYVLDPKWSDEPRGVNRVPHVHLRI